MISEEKLINFEKIINYKFKNKSLLNQSLTHPSFYSENNIKIKKDNQFERYEFLGDRVLGLIIANILLKKFTKFNEGDLSKRYSYLVQKNFLYKISQQLSIQNFLLYDFKKKNKKMLISILSDSVESLIGAIFIDGGYRAAFNFINLHWKPYLDIEISNIQDPKTALQELSQQISKKLPDYKLVNKKGPSHSPVFTINLKVLDLNKITADGTSIREAERKAANEALKIINAKKTT